MTRDDRPRISWSHAPEDGIGWRELGWCDRARVVGIVLAIILVGLAGSLR
jgi:hypothetical protein